MLSDVLRKKQTVYGWIKCAKGMETTGLVEDIFVAGKQKVAQAAQQASKSPSHASEEENAPHTSWTVPDPE